MKQDLQDSPKWLPNVDLNHLPEDQIVSVQKLLTEECDAFTKSDNDMGNIESLKLKLNDTDPIPICKSYHKILTQIFWVESISWGFTDQQIDENFLFMVWEPHGLCLKKRWNYEVCIITEVNKVHPDCMPIPQIQDILDSLGGQNYCTTLDMSRAYHQGYMDRDSHNLTTFTIPWGLHEWLRIPFELLMHSQLSKVLWTNVYWD